MPSKEWERAQLLKRNTLKVKFADLNPTVQAVIGKGSVLEHTPFGWGTDESIKKSPLRNQRAGRVFFEGMGLVGLGSLIVGSLKGAKYSLIVPSAMFGLSVSGRSEFAKMI